MSARPERFTVTADHLRLLRHMYVQWQDDETGAPEIDPKRPYGNSDVPTDVADVLGWTVLMDPDDWAMDPGQSERALVLHRETATALQIVLCTGQFVTGTFIKNSKYDSRSWQLESVQP